MKISFIKKLLILFLTLGVYITYKAEVKANDVYYWGR